MLQNSPSTTAKRLKCSQSLLSSFVSFLQASIKLAMAGKFHRLVALLRKAVPSRSNASSDRLKRTYSTSSSSWESTDADSECDDSPCLAPVDVPEGCFAVYVGGERRRFLVKMQHLNHSLFKALLEKAAEEYGFDQAGALTIPCEAVLFEHVLWLLNNNDAQARSLEIDELLNFYSS